VGGDAPHQSCYFGLACPAGLVVGFVLADSVQKQLPLDVVGIGVVFAVLPNHLIRDHVVALIYLGLRLAEGGHCHGRAVRAVGVVGVCLPAAVHVPREGKELGSVGECVFDGVVVELVSRLLVASAAEPLSRNGPSAFGPACHVDIVAVPVDVKAA